MGFDKPKFIAETKGLAKALKAPIAKLAIPSKNEFPLGETRGSGAISTEKAAD